MMPEELARELRLDANYTTCKATREICLDSADLIEEQAATIARLSAPIDVDDILTLGLSRSEVSTTVNEIIQERLNAG